MIKSQTDTIDGLRVSTSQFPALKGLALFARLGKLIAPALGALEGGITLTSDVSTLGPALGLLFAQADAVGLEQLMTELLALTTVELEGGRLLALTSREAIDLAFSGRPKALLGAAWFVLKVNFADFIAGAGVKSIASGPPAPGA